MTTDEALDLALEALDNLLYWDNGKSDYDQAREAITAIKQARSAPVQEPVAWRYRGNLHEFDPSDWAEGPVTPLYTTPPAAQRQWVGLTDDDKQHIEIMGGKSDVMLAEMVEAKLKEKNT